MTWPRRPSYYGRHGRPRSRNNSEKGKARAGRMQPIKTGLGRQTKAETGNGRPINAAALATIIRNGKVGFRNRKSADQSEPRCRRQ